MLANVKLNWAFGATVAPNTPESLVVVCVIESMFVHVTVVPAVTVSGFGEYAVVVSARAPLTIETAAVLLAGDGVVGVELLLPQALAAIAARMNA